MTGKIQVMVLNAWPDGDCVGNRRDIVKDGVLEI